MPQGAVPGVPGAPVLPGAMPGVPPGPSSAIPDPESISKQKKNYERSIDAELDQKIKMADQELRQRKEALRAQMEQSLAMYKTQLEQSTKQQELALDQEYAQMRMQMQQTQMQQKALLEQQASSLAMEYQQRKIAEEWQMQQDSMHKEMYTLQQRMQQEMEEHQRQAAELQQQHQQHMQAQYAAAGGAPPQAQYGAPGAPPVVYAAAPGAPPAVYAAPPAGTVAAPYPAGYAQVGPTTARQVITAAAAPQTVAGAPQTVVQYAGNARPSEASFSGPTAAAAPQEPTAVPGGWATTTAYTLAAPGANGNVPPSAMAYGGAPRATYGPPPITAMPPTAQGGNPAHTVFDAIDANHDGYITRQEWQHAVGA